MSESLFIYVIGPLVAGIIGGVGYLVKHFINKRDKKREEEIEERNKRRDDIERRLSKNEIDILALQKIIMGCEEPNCPSRRLLAEYLERKLENKL